MPTTNKQPFFGTGWAFPVAFEKRRASSNQSTAPNCGVEMAADLQDIEQSLTIILTTRPGERVMRPDFGCALEDLLFEPINLSLVTYVSNMIETSILYYEPRIKLNNVDIQQEDALEGKLKVEVDFTVRTTNSRFNYVYDFYFREATIVAQ